MKKQYTAAELARLSGYTEKTLQNLRKGQKAGQYEYPPVMIEGKHYLRFGGGVAYTEAGKRLVMKRAEKRGNNNKEMP